jgi:four helix bundle protein
MGKLVQSHRDLEVYGRAFDLAMAIFEASKTFPTNERFSLTDQIRRSSRSVAASIAEGWRKRWYPAVFVNKLSDAESEAAEAQVWLEFAVKCGYLPRTPGAQLYRSCESVIRGLVGIIRHVDDWTPAVRPGSNGRARPAARAIP